MSAVLGALAAPRRREILRLVWTGERSAGEIHGAMPDVSFGAVSQHLKVLLAAKLLDQRSEGRFRYYVARKDELGALRKWLEETWGDALARLKIHAELETARRGPRPMKKHARKRTRRTS